MSKLIILKTTTLGKAGDVVESATLGSKSRIKEVIEKKIARPISEDEIDGIELDRELAADEAKAKDKADEVKGGASPKDAGKASSKKGKK